MEGTENLSDLMEAIKQSVEKMQASDASSVETEHTVNPLRRSLFGDSKSNATEDTFTAPPLKKARLDQQTPEQRIVKSKRESQRIKVIRDCLHGIPPPPSLTNPRISIEEVVEKLNEYFDDIIEKSPILNCKTQEKPVTPERISLDVYYNDNLKCETLDFLYEKVRQRYVMNETCSFVSTAPKYTVIESPLSCDILDMLPRSMSSPASPAPANLSAELAQRRSRMRNAQTSQPVRKSPRKANMTIKNPNLRMSGLIAQRDAFLLKVTPKEQPKVSKPVTKYVTVPAIKNQARKSEEKLPKLEELSETHQKKLNWATVTALKTVSPNLMEDTKFFKKCRQSLFRLCLVQWLKQQDTYDKGEPKPALGTSNRMLELATQLAPQIVNSMTSS